MEDTSNITSGGGTGAREAAGLQLHEAYELLWSQSPDAAILTSPNARIKLVNPAVSTLFGVPEQELMGQNVLHLFSNRRGEPDRGTIRAALEAHGKLENYETYVARPGGMRLAVALNVQRVVDGRKRNVGYLGAVRDVTEYIEKIYTDPLTGLGNRRAFDAALRGEVGRALVEHKPLGLLWVDLDEFKRRNKEFGYQTCDDYLVALARMLESAVPPFNPFYPRVFRWGGDEETILLNDPEVICREVAEEIVQDVRALRLPGQDGRHVLAATASVGVAMLSDVALRGTPEGIARDLIWKAGRAVFAAKDSGRDQAVRWEPGLA